MNEEAYVAVALDLAYRMAMEQDDTHPWLIRKAGPDHQTMGQVFYLCDQQTWCVWMEVGLMPGYKFSILRLDSRIAACDTHAAWCRDQTLPNEEEVLAAKVKHEIFPDEVEDWR